MTFATNFLGPFALTEALVPHLSNGANVVFVASGVEDPERKPAKAVGYRGGRYISAEASARGEWKPGGSKMPGYDAYATSKQAVLAAAMAFARETPRLRFNALEPGFTPNTGLVREAPIFARILLNYILHLRMMTPALIGLRSDFDIAAEIIEASHESQDGFAAIVSCEVIGTEIMILDAVLQHVPHSGKHGSSGGEDGLFSAMMAPR